MTPLIHEIIHLAWADEVSFDTINRQYGVSEAQVIKIMRKHLKLSSFKIWRTRVYGRLAKHGQLAKVHQHQHQHQYQYQYDIKQLLDSMDSMDSMDSLDSMESLEVMTESDFTPTAQSSIMKTRA